MSKKGVITDQKHFFNINSEVEKAVDTGSFFYNYINKEQFDGFNWLENGTKILDYGCGTATSMDVFFMTRAREVYEFYGVDIAEHAIEKARKKYPEYKFYVISANKIPEISPAYLDSAYLFHVLHHANDHQGIFNEIYSKLKPGGKLLINDLTSDNPFIKLGRLFFVYMPGLVKKKFSEDDLVVDGEIPEKYKDDIPMLLTQLSSAGFSIVEVRRGHLFVFLFAWVDKFIRLSKFNLIRAFYSWLIAVEKKLEKSSLMMTYGEVISIKCLKKAKNDN